MRTIAILFVVTIFEFSSAFGNVSGGIRTRDLTEDVTVDEEKVKQLMEKYKETKPTYNPT